MSRISAANVFSFLLILTFSFSIIQAQDDDTNGEGDMGIVEVEEPLAFEDTTLERTFNQDDLGVLVGNVQRPNGITWFDGNLYTACNGDWTLYQIDDTTGATQTFIFGIQDTHSMEILPSEDGFDIWAPDFSKNQITRVNQDRSAPESINDEIDGPWGITFLPEQESFLITSLRENEIVQMDLEGTITPLIDGLRSPAGLASDEAYVYVANNGSARRAIEWFDLAEEEPELQPLVSGLQNVSNVVLAPDNLLYFTYALGTRGVVGRVDPEGCRDEGCSNEDVEIVLFTELPAPLAGLAFSDDMRLFVHTIYRPEIYWVSLYGDVAETSTESDSN